MYFNTLPILYFSFVFANYVQMVRSFPAESSSSTGDKNKQEKQSSFLSEYLTVLGAKNQIKTGTSVATRPLVNEVPPLAPTQLPVLSLQLTGADAIEDAIHAALDVAKAQFKTTKAPRRRPSSTARSPHEIKLGGSRRTVNRVVPYPTAIYTDAVSLLGIPTTLAPWARPEAPPVPVIPATLAPWALPEAPPVPGIAAQIDPALNNYLSLMSPEDLLALHAYQDQLIHQNPGVSAINGVTSTTEGTPGDYIAGFFGSLGAANLGGMAENAFRLLASQHVQGFFVGLADQVTCQLGKNCKRPKENKNDTDAYWEFVKVMKDV